MSRGLLTGELTGPYPATDFRAHAPRFTGETFEINKKKVALLKDMAKKLNCSASQLAMTWVMHRGNDILPVFDTTKLHRLKENTDASE